MPLMISLLAAVCLQSGLTGPAADLYKQAQQGKFYAKAAELMPEILPTSDGRSFLAVWKTVDRPDKWIVTMHGSHGFATDDLALWSSQLRDRKVGMVSLQWWLGGDAYYSPDQSYVEIDRALRKLGVKAGQAMFHGFSRGSANSYAVVAQDASRGGHYFSLAVASSGGVGLDYPPTKAIGKDDLKGTKWITSAGGRDSHPDRDGIEGMRKAAAWLKEHGATVLYSIEDPDYGHGALQTNPKNAKRVLDAFLGAG